MRVAVVSDVHGNLTALEAVIADLKRRSPDQIVHGGDLALMGPQPAQVVDRIRELGWPGVQGNTDELLWRPEDRALQLERAPALAPHIELLFDSYAPFTREALGVERIEWLRAQPAEYRDDPLALVHASPGDLWRAPLPDAPDGELAETYEPLGAPLVAYGHIHRPFTRTLDATTIANTGSVGMPWDGDPRAAYLLIDDGVAEVVRVEYDLEADARALRAVNHPDTGRVEQMHREARFVAPS